MKPWETLAAIDVPDNGGKMILSKRDTEYSIAVDGYELMNSRLHYSEEVLAELACGEISKCKEPKVLIGGLGMGFTLASALKHLPSKATIVVAELVPEVIQWNKEFFSELNNHALSDKRVTVKAVDVGDIINSEKHGFDAIIMDVDNGPEDLTREKNNWLYTTEGLKTTFNALCPAGILAVWSLEKKGTFTKRLNKTGFNVTEKTTRAKGPKSGGRHHIWLAKKPQGSKKKK